MGMDSFRSYVIDVSVIEGSSALSVTIYVHLKAFDLVKPFFDLTKDHRCLGQVGRQVADGGLKLVGLLQGLLQRKRHGSKLLLPRRLCPPVLEPVLGKHFVIRNGLGLLQPGNEKIRRYGRHTGWMLFTSDRMGFPVG